MPSQRKMNSSTKAAPAAPDDNAGYGPPGSMRPGRLESDAIALNKTRRLPLQRDHGLPSNKCSTLDTTVEVLHSDDIVFSTRSTFQIP